MVVPSFPWTSSGWDGKPETKTATGTEILYRAFDVSSGSKSGKWGRFFFMPRVAGLSVNHLTADRLEVELNAALWGNKFERLGKFSMVPGATYLIGNIAQGDYSEKDFDEDSVFQAQSFVVPSSLFRQVFLDQPRISVRFLGDVGIKAGRLHRHSLKTWN